MREARSSSVPVEKRAADYLQAAAVTAPLLGTGIGTPACETYNAACGELTVLLRSSEGGRLWNHPLTLAGNNTSYRLRLEPASDAVWSPDYFTSFVPSAEIKETLIRKENYQQGVGGSLVGVRMLNPPEKFAPPRGITSPATATLDFHATNAALALRRPRKYPTARVEGKVRPLNADFSAPLSYYEPPANLFFVGIMGALRAAHYEKRTGLYFLQPYDPDRIPVVFVHGLISTPFDWVQTINGLQADPEIRKHYQFWVFAYPTGNPVLYSALRLREELARVDKLIRTIKAMSWLVTVWGDCFRKRRSRVWRAAIGRKHWEDQPCSSSQRCNRRTLLPEPRRSRATPVLSGLSSFVLPIAVAKWRQAGSASLLSS